MPEPRTAGVAMSCSGIGGDGGAAASVATAATVGLTVPAALTPGFVMGGDGGGS